MSPASGRPSGAGPSDAGPSGAGPSDAGPSDAGPSDAGPSDAGPSDADPPEAVLFDFSGTLFHIESAHAAVVAALGESSAPSAPDLARLGAINGSGTPDELPDALREVWDARDMSVDAHRAAYSGMARMAGLSNEQAHLLYERGIDAAAWTAFPDTVEVLTRLRTAGVPVAVVSNIGWDPRPVLRRWRVAELVDVLVLSYERGVQKPDPAVFRLACAELGVKPDDALMVGDNRDADGAAVAVGCRFAWVTPDADQREPTALLRAVGLV